MDMCMDMCMYYWWYSTSQKMPPEMLQAEVRGEEAWRVASLSLSAPCVTGMAHILSALCLSPADVWQGVGQQRVAGLVVAQHVGVPQSTIGTELVHGIRKRV